MTAKLSDAVARLGRRLPAAPADPDADLLGRFLQSRDEGAFAALVRRHGPLVLGVCRRVTGDHHLAEDLVQAALVQAARHWERIETSPEAYVRRTMYHQNISWWRRRKLAETPLQSYDAPVPAADPTVRLTLEQALRRLTPRQRTVLVLRYFEDLTEVRTAAELGISSGAVKSMSRQALQRLRVLAPELADLVGADA